MQEFNHQTLLDVTIRLKELKKVFWGGYSGYFKDPDGHLWEVAHNPHFWIGPSDNST